MDTAQHIEGFRIPVHRSLTQPIMMAGAPRASTILNGTLAAALGLGLQLWPVGIVIWALSQTACVFAAKRDPLFLDVLRRHLRQKSYLS